MTKNNNLTKENFDALLKWFDKDPDRAGSKYEEIRAGLIRFFTFKGCGEPESLADETINRVAVKFTSLDTDNPNKHITYFYGFASKIYLEYRRQVVEKTVPFEPLVHDRATAVSTGTGDREGDSQCLDSCLSTLSFSDRKITIQYFQKEKSEKIRNRRELAEREGLTVGALHVKIHRIKGNLRRCVEKCRESGLRL